MVVKKLVDFCAVDFRRKTGCDVTESKRAMIKVGTPPSPPFALAAVFFFTQRVVFPSTAVVTCNRLCVDRLYWGDSSSVENVRLASRSYPHHNKQISRWIPCMKALI